MRARMLAAIPVAAAAAMPAAAPASAAGWGGSWQMNEAAGSKVMHDLSGNGNTGSLGKGVRATGAGYFHFSHTGVATVPDSSTLDPGSANFSYSVRVRTTYHDDDFNLVQKGHVGTRGGYWKADVYKGVAFCKWVSPTATRSVRAPLNIFNGQWHVITCHKTATSVSITVDAGTSSQRTQSSSVQIGSISNAAPLSIGGKGYCPRGDCDYFLGDIDWVRVWAG